MVVRHLVVLFNRLDCWNAIGGASAWHALALSPGGRSSCGERGESGQCCSVASIVRWVARVNRYQNGRLAAKIPFLAVIRSGPRDGAAIHAGIKADGLRRVACVQAASFVLRSVGTR